MTSADKFGIAFAIGFTAVMIGLVSGGTFETSQPSPIQSAPTQTYSPPPQAAVEESAPTQATLKLPVLWANAPVAALDVLVERVVVSPTGLCPITFQKSFYYFYL